MVRIRRTPRRPRRFAPTGRAPLDGTAAEVLSWVGSDPRRAQLCYDAEHLRGDDARSSLLTRLVRLGAEEG